jgi:hypothetical protein
MIDHGDQISNQAWSLCLEMRRLECPHGHPPEIWSPSLRVVRARDSDGGTRLRSRWLWCSGILFRKTARLPDRLKRDSALRKSHDLTFVMERMRYAGSGQTESGRAFTSRSYVEKIRSQPEKVEFEHSEMNQGSWFVKINCRNWSAQKNCNYFMFLFCSALKGRAEEALLFDSKGMLVLLCSSKFRCALLTPVIYILFIMLVFLHTHKRVFSIRTYYFCISSKCSFRNYAPWALDA